LRLTPIDHPRDQPSIDDRDGPLYLSRASSRSYTDLGFGRVVAQQVRGRFLTHDGEPTSRKYGLGAQRIERFYLRALAAPLPVFLAWGLGRLLLLQRLLRPRLPRARRRRAARRRGQRSVSDPFLRAFSFSVGIFTTTGHRADVRRRRHRALARGARVVLRPVRARRHRRVAHRAPHAPAHAPALQRVRRRRAVRGGPRLMFRIVNVQPGESERRAGATEQSRCSRKSIGSPRAGTSIRWRSSGSRWTGFTLHWTIVHPITEGQPAQGRDPDSLRGRPQAELLVLVNAHEETFSTRVTTRASYWWDEIRWDAKFASIFARLGGRGARDRRRSGSTGWSGSSPERRASRRTGARGGGRSARELNPPQGGQSR
jgi:inward rectifier potassium channel